ncbi:DNA-binding LytR/AlgR family response regulator [Clostridium tetanomorphum]|uniref:LytTR family DNA-binding domain-containing protein n=1 Tax=Clostridium tetanomorphum TaxID=1553 RepID=UPI00044C4719|nr:LytTR family DNA-binding domain-containing protein [Clostridium tetanomorphum]KAJ52692.1 response regulator receiver protein [Clostridium tetanomorphum DSM 665]MBP1863285.1 DNA-binding LytR/AlgR family response regulator [Clostridium tetanomorphum]NRS84393.1 DNA-binding LytR/AlgR family response regulator [Clostridium tetanomorphum]SQB92145.1 response regulator receiver protein [Clostridium tetanomorphum]
MRIKIIENPLIEEIEIHILCKENNDYIKQLAENLTEVQMDVTGKMQNEYVKISLRDIYYFESVDNRTYIYCEKHVYQSDMKLYELEEQLSGTRFTRINKSCIMNISKLEKVKSQINGRLLATLCNGENLIINRRYVLEIKRKLNR